MTVFSSKSLAAFEAGTGDIIVVASDGTEIKAHSFVLCHSPVIEAALSGEMQEAASRRLTVDCNSETAKAFLKFLYTGRLLLEGAMSLDVIIDLIRLADFYAVEVEFSATCSEGEGATAVSKVMDSLTWQISNYAVVQALQQLSQIRSQHSCAMMKQCIQRIDPQLGKNMFEWLCNFQAMGALEVLMQALKSKRIILPSLDAAWLDHEFSQDALRHLSGTHFEHPHVLLDALPAYFELVGLATPSKFERSEPKVGDIFQNSGGRCGVILEEVRREDRSSSVLQGSTQEERSTTTAAKKKKKKVVRQPAVFESRPQSSVFENTPGPAVFESRPQSSVFESTPRSSVLESTPQSTVFDSTPQSSVFESRPPQRSVFERKPGPSVFESRPEPQYLVQFGNTTEVRCLRRFAVHEHTLLLGRFPEVLDTVTHCVFSCEKI
eukprot:TRINITY_DN2367_c0_g1_i1.p1 TRINITY_DN2367_c0_g1~~TRINITY_DN2367_c0_g1_i1.p1  ORF type:complete len:471 (-),score=36.66 TRINITY_DN2367_c0_g1_i1:345-1652(-)